MTKNLSNIDQTRRGIQDLKVDLRKWEGVHKQLLLIENTEIQAYNVHDQIIVIENLIFTLTVHLKKMGGR